MAQHKIKAIAAITGEETKFNKFIFNHGENQMKKVKMTVAAIALTAIAFTSCASKPEVQTQAATTAAAPVYSSVQEAPVTAAQAQSANRGVKLEKEECEEKALEQVANMRESGNAISENESFGVNLALLDARAKLSQQLEGMVNGMIRSFDEQHASGQNAGSYAGKGTQVQQAYFEQFLTNTRPICKNTYVREDGRYNVYVAIEMGEPEQKAMYNQLKKDEKMAIDFDEAQFLKELQAAKEEYRKQKEAQQ